MGGGLKTPGGSLPLGLLGEVLLAWTLIQHVPVEDSVDLGFFICLMG